LTGPRQAQLATIVARTVEAETSIGCPEVGSKVVCGSFVGWVKPTNPILI
jgi:hypothetical protein